MVNRIPSVRIEFDVTTAEKTIAWFYSGKKQPTYQKGSVSLYDVLPNGIEVHRMAKAMLFRCRGYLGRVVMYSHLGAVSLRIDDWYGWGRYQRGEMDG